MKLSDTLLRDEVEVLSRVNTLWLDMYSVKTEIVDIKVPAGDDELASIAMGAFKQPLAEMREYILGRLKELHDGD